MTDTPSPDKAPRESLIRVHPGPSVVKYISMRDKKAEHIARILGVGFNNEDGHTRHTEGENFVITQGSEKTHQEMTEICMKIDQELKARGLSLGDMTKEEMTRFLENLNIS